jgi:hypothetical protein
LTDIPGFSPLKWDHPERRREYNRAYYRANRERLLARQRAYEEANKEDRNEYAKRRREATREVRRQFDWEISRTARHGITWTVRDWMYESQGEACAGCGKAMPNVELQIDHDHECCSGKYSCGRCVRGLVCRPCNIGNVMVGVFAKRFGEEGVA